MPGLAPSARRYSIPFGRAEVVAGREHAPGAAHDHHPDRLVRPGQDEGLVDLVQHPVVLGVAVGRPVQGDGRDGAVNGIENILEIHACLRLLLAGTMPRKALIVHDGCLRRDAVPIKSRPERDLMADIFISYAREDRQWVEKLANQLQSEGFTVWWDWDLLVGKRYRETIDTELQTCKTAVVVWSQHSVQSDFVRDEAEEAQQRNILVPVLKEVVRPPAGFRRYRQPTSAPGLEAVIMPSSAG